MKVCYSKTSCPSSTNLIPPKFASYIKLIKSLFFLDTAPTDIFVFFSLKEIEIGFSDPKFPPFAPWSKISFCKKVGFSHKIFTKWSKGLKICANYFPFDLSSLIMESSFPSPDLEIWRKVNYISLKNNIIAFKVGWTVPGVCWQLIAAKLIADRMDEEEYKLLIWFSTREQLHKLISKEQWLQNSLVWLSD